MLPVVASSFTFSTINPPGSTYSIANGINDSGQIVGLYTTGPSPGEVEYGFLLSGGSYTTIDVPGSELTIALGIKR
jgi:uncharacterized membrane protein